MYVSIHTFGICISQSVPVDSNNFFTSNRIYKQLEYKYTHTYVRTIVLNNVYVFAYEMNMLHHAYNVCIIFICMHCIYVHNTYKQY